VCSSHAREYAQIPPQTEATRLGETGNFSCLSICSGSRAAGRWRLRTAARDERRAAIARLLVGGDARGAGPFGAEQLQFRVVEEVLEWGDAATEDPFDVWFREQTREVHGVDIEDGVPAPELLMSFEAVPTAP
jgi:hypothetical protein